MRKYENNIHGKDKTQRKGQVVSVSDLSGRGIPDDGRGVGEEPLRDRANQLFYTSVRRFYNETQEVLEEALAEAVDYCIEKGILEEF